MQYPSNWITFLRKTTPTFYQPINIQNTHQLYASDSEWNYMKSTILYCMPGVFCARVGEGRGRGRG